MDRPPVVAGRFYDGVADNLNAVVDGFLGLGAGRREEPTLLAMVPHAGYVFSGAVCGRTLAEANLAETVLLLGPNHTGRGAPFALWSEGNWMVPGGPVPVDTELAEELMAADSHITPDIEAHLGEHSIEVVLPFLQRLNPATRIAPIAVSMPHLEVLEQVGRHIGQALKVLGRPVSIVVSSDMSHYITHEDAKKRDAMAIGEAVKLDPAALFNIVRSRNISMCGVMPMTVGLFAALELGASRGELVAYATSGEVSGDYDQVVGYAGVLVS
jgi:hypothetical protein